MSCTRTGTSTSTEGMNGIQSFDACAAAHVGQHEPKHAFTKTPAQSQRPVCG
jgi:hypothetical protein